LSIPSAHGIVLIFNENSPLHAVSPQHFGRLVGEVIQKPQSSGKRRFPHIQGMVYFSSETMQTYDEQTKQYMPFWSHAQVRGDSAEQVARFQSDLKQGWYKFVERITGASVVAHKRETGWPDGSGGGSL
jgi:hypothetical protein